MNRILMNEGKMPRLLGQGLLATAEGFYHADRQLPFHVLIYVLEGAIYVTEDGTEHAVEPGGLLFLRSGLRHYGKQRIPKGTRWYYVHFELPQPCDGTAAPEEGQSMLLPKALDGLSGSGIERELAALVENGYQRDNRNRWYLNQQLFLLLSHIGHLTCREERKPGLPERIAEYLTAQAKRPFSTRELERVFFVSYKHMAAVFKKYYGETMHTYHRRLRMEEAARLLRETLLPVGEISEQLGFGDQLYFSRCFREFAGFSPSEYRKRVREY